MWQTKEKLKDFFSKEVNPYNLGIFRFILGIGIFWTFIDKYEYILYLTGNSIYFSGYSFFEWVRPLLPEYMGIVLKIGMISSLLLAFGLLKRISLYVTFLIFTYFFLIDIGHYNNHYYLYILLLILFITLGVPQTFSLNNLRRNVKFDREKKWKLDLIKLQFTIMYLFGGLVKLNIDWLNGYPLKIWLYQASNNYEGILNTILQSNYLAMSMTYMGLMFDLGVGIALWFRFTRKFAILFLVFFHVVNFFLWDIGSFPFVALGSTIIFFPAIAYAQLISNDEIIDQSQNNYSKISIAFFSLWLLIQILVPMRSVFYDGHVFYNGEGLKFSWRMKLFQTEAANKITIRIPETKEQFDVNIDSYVNINQLMHMNINPTSFMKFCIYLKKSIKKNNPKVNPEIYMEIWRSVNGRDLILINDTAINYATVNYEMIKQQSCFKSLELKNQNKPKLYKSDDRNWDKFGY